jgi:hypothetical protein
LKKIFRSIINIRKNKVPTIPEKELTKNYRVFLSSKIKPEDPSNIKMYEWIESYYREFKEMPSIEFLYQKAESEGAELIVASLTEIVQEIPFWGSDYKAIVKSQFEEQCEDEFKSLIEKTWQITKNGIEIKSGRGKKKRKIKGLHDAITFLTSRSKKFLFNSFRTKYESQIRSLEDSNEVMEEYRKRKKDPYSNVGLFVDLDKIDTTIRGIKCGDLVLLAAFVANGKSTFAVNLAYSGMMQGLNGLFVSLEMQYDEMRDMFYTLHMSYPGWYAHPKFGKLTGKITYNKVRYAELSDLEEEFFNAACEDFGTNKEDFGELFLSKPPENCTPSYLEMMLLEYNNELKDRGKTLDFLVLDYVGLMVQDLDQKYGDWRVDLNNMIRRLKNITINFDNGRGLRIITPYQFNRQGHKEAAKNDGIYTLSALSDANEAERSSDCVIAIYSTDEMRDSGLIKISCLKNRDGKIFPPFEANLDFSTKKLNDFSQTVENSKDEMNIDDISKEISLL